LQTTQYINIVSTVPLVPPRAIREELPQTETAIQTVIDGRRAVGQILAGEDPRLLVTVGPCSIHDEAAALQYAQRLKTLADKVSDTLFIVMRVYFEKPRTTIGWKGLINDPYMDGTFDIATGLRRARSLLLRISDLGLPAGTEMLDPISPPYFSDIVTWASIGARTTESQTHRQMASGLSMPIGYKNGTDGDIQIALDAMEAARHPHSFLGIDVDGQTCVVNTKGNPLGHLILRGGRSGPNYDQASVQDAAKKLEATGVTRGIMIDCSHANSNKHYQQQAEVWNYTIDQVATGNQSIMGLMLESNLIQGSQKIPDDLSKLEYGVSITDGCLGWDTTQDLLLYAHDALKRG